MKNKTTKQTYKKHKHANKQQHKQETPQIKNETEQKGTVQNKTNHY